MGGLAVGNVSLSNNAEATAAHDRRACMGYAPESQPARAAQVGAYIGAASNELMASVHHVGAVVGCS